MTNAAKGQSAPDKDSNNNSYKFVSNEKVLLPGLRRYPVLLLDYDGTMAETRPAILCALQEALRDCGCATLNETAARRLLAGGGTLHDFFRAHEPNATLQEMDAFAADYHKRYLAADLKETHLFPGVKETIPVLRESGFRLISVSNKREDTLRESLTRFELIQYFEAVVGAEVGEPRKPDASVWTERVAPLLPGIAPGACLAVGDTEADLEFANNAGTGSCWAMYGFGNPVHCEALHPDYRIATFPDLLTLLRTMSA